MENKIRIFQKDEVIFKEGAYESCMYIVDDGSVSIYAQHGTKDEKLLTTLEAGAFFGEIGITETLPRTATAIAAQDDTRLVEITLDNFSAYFSREPQKLLAIMRNMSSRLRALTADYLEAAEAVSEAVESAKKGDKHSDSLSAKLARLVQNSVMPAFRKGGKAFDEVAFINAQEEPDYAIKGFKKNEVIFREGDAANCMYDIHWGRVGIYANYGSENQKLLTELNTEGFFGEMGLLDTLPRSATAVALDADTKVQVISEDVFARYLRDKPTKVIMIMMHLSSRIRGLTHEYMKTCRLAAATEAAAKKLKTNAWADVPMDSVCNTMFDSVDPQACYGRFSKYLY